MKTKPYSPIEEKPIIAKEAMLSYGCLTREIPNPYTIEEIHDSMDEAESDFIAGRVYAHEDVMQEMREYIMTL